MQSCAIAPKTNALQHISGQHASLFTLCCCASKAGSSLVPLYYNALTALTTTSTLYRLQICCKRRYSNQYTPDVHDPSAGVVEASCRSTTTGAGNVQAQPRLAPTRSLLAGPDAPAAPLPLSSQRLSLLHSDCKRCPAVKELDPSVICSLVNGPRAAPQGYGIPTILLLQFAVFIEHPPVVIIRQSPAHCLCMQTEASLTGEVHLPNANIHSTPIDRQFEWTKFYLFFC